MAASDPVNIECRLSAMDDTNSGILSLGFVVNFRYCATKSPCGKFLNFIMAMCYLVFGYFNTVFCWLVRLTNPIEARKSCSYEICGNMELNKKAAAPYELILVICALIWFEWFYLVVHWHMNPTIHFFLNGNMRIFCWSNMKLEWLSGSKRLTKKKLANNFTKQ